MRGWYVREQVNKINSRRVFVTKHELGCVVGYYHFPQKRGENYRVSLVAPG